LKYYLISIVILVGLYYIKYHTVGVEDERKEKLSWILGGEENLRQDPENK